MVSGFPDISKLVILFNCGVVHTGYSEWLCRICNKQPQPWEPWPISRPRCGGGCPWPIGKLWWYPRPYPEKRGRHRWRGIALYRAHRPKSNPEKLSKSEGKMGNNAGKARINGSWAECPWCRKKLCRVQEKWRAYGIELYCPRCKKGVMLERE